MSFGLSFGILPPNRLNKANSVCNMPPYLIHNCKPCVFQPITALGLYLAATCKIKLRHRASILKPHLSLSILRMKTVKRLHMKGKMCWAGCATNECQKGINIVCFIELPHCLNIKHVQMTASGLITVSHTCCVKFV